ncbi:MAG: YciI family protein [Chloroflexota bacterium]
MRYLMLIYADERINMRPDTLKANEMSGGYTRFTEDVRERGLLEGGEALQPVATATTVRVRNGERLITDGPFAETQEQLGGYYLLNCKDLDEAIECAAAIPGAQHGSVEIRPIWEMR